MTENPDVLQKLPRAEPGEIHTSATGRPVPSRGLSGALIVVEGTDGSGKSTQLYLLKRWLESAATGCIHGVEFFAAGEIGDPARKAAAVADAGHFFAVARADFADRCDAKSCRCCRAITWCWRIATFTRRSRGTRRAAARRGGCETCTASRRFRTSRSISARRWTWPCTAS